MKIASILENQKIEKRIAITPEIAKKYISLGFEVSLSENYGEHLGFSDDDYKLFTDARKFGTLYTLYSDVGKNLEALAMDNDKHHHDIVPNLHYSADCNIFFNTETDIELKQRKQKYKEYAQQNKHYLETKGYSENDIRLTTGHIPLASLETDLNEKEILFQDH